MQPRFLSNTSNPFAGLSAKQIDIVQSTLAKSRGPTADAKFTAARDAPIRASFTTTGATVLSSLDRLQAGATVRPTYNASAQVVPPPPTAGAEVSVEA